MPAVDWRVGATNDSACGRNVAHEHEAYVNAEGADGDYHSEAYGGVYDALRDDHDDDRCGDHGYDHIDDHSDDCFDVHNAAYSDGHSAASADAHALDDGAY